MNIDRLAPWYRWIEYAAFGGAVERRRFAFLGSLRGARRILILGEGDGRALARILEIAPGARIDVVEISGTMVALAARRAGNSARVSFQHRDARSIEFPENFYDAVVTFFFLDCFPEDEARPLVRRLVDALRPGGVWLVSDFALPTRGWQRWHARAWVWAMYRFFRVAAGLRMTQLPPIATTLSRAGMTRIAQEKERFGMIVSEVLEKQILTAVASPVQPPAAQSDQPNDASGDQHAPA